MRNDNNKQSDTSSCDCSSIVSLNQSSNITNFSSSGSHPSYRIGQFSHDIPNSIVFDDVINGKAQDIGHDVDMQTDGYPAIDLSSIVDITTMDDNWQGGGVDSMMSHEAIDDVTIESTSSSSVNSSNNGSPLDLDYSNIPYHAFEEASREETASFQIMSLLDRAGAPRICYNRLVALLKKLAKREGFDVRKTLNRETLMRRLERKCKARPIIENETINERQVFRFQFHQMLQDLINSSGEHLQEIVPDHQINKEPPPESEHELWNTTWMKETFQMEEYKDFNSLTDRMLPVILYMDKTGTDVNQSKI